MPTRHMNEFYAKPNQSPNWGSKTCAKRMFPSLSILAIPASDRIAGLYSRYLNSKRGYAYANDFIDRLRTLTDHALV